jgi:gamma-glutamyltranspeptidase/glutathione hydrolase
MPRYGAWQASNIGGGGFMMVYPGPGREPVGVGYRETAPAAATERMLADTKEMTGHRVCGTPGTVAGLALAHQQYGKLPWRVRTSERSSIRVGRRQSSPPRVSASQAARASASVAGSAGAVRCPTRRVRSSRTVPPASA